MKLVYTDEAIDDLKRLREFVVVHDSSAAARIATELVGKIELLPNFSGMGTPVKWHRSLTLVEIWLSGNTLFDIQFMPVPSLFSEYGMASRANDSNLTKRGTRTPLFPLRCKRRTLARR